MPFYTQALALLAWLAWLILDISKLPSVNAAHGDARFLIYPTLPGLFLPWRPQQH